MQCSVLGAGYSVMHLSVNLNVIQQPRAADSLILHYLRVNSRSTF